MQTVTTPESELIGLLYESVLDTRAWASFFARLVEIMNLRSSNLTTVNINTGEPCAYFEGGESVNAHYRQLYAERFSREDELALMALQNPPGQLICFQDLPADIHQRISDSAFYREWATPQGIYQAVVCSVRVEGPWRTMFMAHRNQQQGLFTDSEKQLFQTLLPHLQRASQLHMRLNEAGGYNDIANVLDRFSYGVAIVDDKAFICHANSAGERIFQQHPDLAIEHQRIKISSDAISRRFNLSILEAVRASVGLEQDRTEIFTLNNNSPDCLIILVMPFSTRDTQQRQRAMLLFYEPGKNRKPNKTLVASLWGLSPAETALVCELVTGLSLEECTESLHRSKETLRSYLKNIFLKTGVNRQSDLIALVLTSPAMQPID